MKETLYRLISHAVLNNESAFFENNTDLFNSSNFSSDVVMIIDHDVCIGNGIKYIIKKGTILTKCCFNTKCYVDRDWKIGEIVIRREDIREKSISINI